jgi:hypothetical protein
MASVLRAMGLASVLAFSAEAAVAQSVFDPNDADHVAYVEGNYLFLGYHEAGHMILNLLRADQAIERPMLEGVADGIAVWLMLPDPDEPEQDTDILAAIVGWEESAFQGDETGVAANPHYPDDGERAENIACLLVGANPDTYARLMDEYPDSTDEADCRQKFEELDDGFASLFGNQILRPGSTSGSRVRVDYMPTPANAAYLQPAQEFMETGKLLEDLADDISEFVALPDGVSIVGRSCGRGAAEFRYSASRRQITACYEAVDWFMRNLPPELGGTGAPAPVAGGAEPDTTTTPEGDDLGSGGSRVTRNARPRPR